MSDSALDRVVRLAASGEPLEFASEGWSDVARLRSAEARKLKVAEHAREIAALRPSETKVLDGATVTKAPSGRVRVTIDREGRTYGSPQSAAVATARGSHRPTAVTESYNRALDVIRQQRGGSERQDLSADDPALLEEQARTGTSWLDQPAQPGGSLDEAENEQREDDLRAMDDPTLAREINSAKPGTERHASALDEILRRGNGAVGPQFVPRGGIPASWYPKGGGMVDEKGRPTSGAKIRREMQSGKRAAP